MYVYILCMHVYMNIYSYNYSCDLRESLPICCMERTHVLRCLYWYLTIYLSSDFMNSDVCKYSFLVFPEESPPPLSLLAEIKGKGKKTKHQTIGVGV